MAKTIIELVKDMLINGSDLKNWVILIVILGIAFIGYQKDVALAEDVEKIKSELSRRNIRFTRHAELQIECLKEMYNMLVSYHYELHKFLYSKEVTIDNFKKYNLSSQNTFNELIMYCQRNRILLTDSIVNQFKIVQNKFNEHNIFVAIELQAISDLKDLNQTYDVNYLYGSAENERTAVLQHYKYINDKFDTKAYESDVLKLREVIEDYFKSLVD